MTATPRYLAVFLALVLNAGAWAQDYPKRPIRVFVPYAPGGATDTVTRIIAPAISEILKQPLVIDNRTGASGNIAVELTAKAAPDGYTLLMGTVSTNAINPALFAHVLNVAPHQFVGIEVGRVAGQKMQSQATTSGFDVVTHQGLLVCGQSVDDQMHGLFAMTHHSLEQFNKQLATERTLVRLKPKTTSRIDRRGGRDRLALTGVLHHRGLAAYVSRRRFHPFIDCRAAKSERGDNIGRLLAFANALKRHAAF